MRGALQLAGAAAVLVAAGTARAQPAPAPTTTPATGATATVLGVGGNPVHGVVRFTQVDGGVEIEAEIMALTPGKHGFNIHEFGDCSSDGSSAGPSFNPGETLHGTPGAPASHAGGFGNLEADASGRALLKVVSHAITLDEGPDGVVGRSVIVHARPDDPKTQPTGNAGGRLGCGVILLDGGNTILVRKQ
jgi:superoxide dismutase, Cu-Zn family